MSKTKAEKKAPKIVPYNELTNKVAAIWTRVSSEEQEKSNCSLDTQRSACEDYASTHGIRIKRYFGGTHESAKHEGKIHKEMVREVLRDKEINVILVRTFDRFGRAGAETILTKEELKRHGVYVISATEPCEPDSQLGSVMQNFMDLFSQMENNIRRDKTYSGTIASLNRGEWCLHLPLGYSRLGKTNGHHNIVVNEYGKLLRNAFIWRAAGEREIDILGKLKSLGLTMNKQHLSKILKNPFYTGWIIHELVEGGRIRGNHEVLIDEETFRRANGLSRAGYEHKEITEDFPLKRHVRCASCGGYLTGYTVKSRNKSYYKCNTIGCRANYSTIYLHQNYIELLEGFKVEEEQIPLVIEKATELIMQYNQERATRSHELKRQCIEIDKKINSVKYKYGLGEITKDVYNATIQTLVENKAIFQQKLELEAGKLSNISTTLPRAILTICKLGDYWNDGDFFFRQKLQKTIFPNGIMFDKKTGNYRTISFNYIASLPRLLLGSYEPIKTKSDLDFLSKSPCVEKRRLERPTPTSRTWCATSCATSRLLSAIGFPKAGAKVLLFFESTKYFVIFFALKAIFYLWSQWVRSWR